jgi:hemin uptake protein HemP
MDHHPISVPAGAGAMAEPWADVPVGDSASPTSNWRELLVRHGQYTYRLRIAASNKMILTK